MTDLLPAFLLTVLTVFLVCCSEVSNYYQCQLFPKSNHFLKTGDTVSRCLEVYYLSNKNQNSSFQSSSEFPMLSIDVARNLRIKHPKSVGETIWVKGFC